ncbi:MAG: SMP-30/gluconolactonase/LRE family protein, partial [Cyanobacteria bacterium J06649_4]
LTQADEGCGGEQEQPGSFVFRFDPTTGGLNAVVTDMERPNGLAFSPDETTLYVSDTSAVENADMCHDIRAYDITDGHEVSTMRIFAVVEPGQPDGFCVDQGGNVFTSAQDGVQIYSPTGDLIGKIRTPEICTNITFGGDNCDRLFITTNSSLYTIQTQTKGASCFLTP